MQHVLTRLLPFAYLLVNPGWMRNTGKRFVLPEMAILETQNGIVEAQV